MVRSLSRNLSRDSAAGALSTSMAAESTGGTNFNKKFRHSQKPSYYMEEYR